MIDHILLIFSTIIIYEFIKYVQMVNIIKSNFKIYKKMTKLFKCNNVLESRKEKLIFNYSKSLLIISMRIFIIFFSVFIFFLIIGLLSNSYLYYAFSILGIIEVSIIFIIYALIRKKIDAKL